MKKPHPCRCKHPLPADLLGNCGYCGYPVKTPKKK